MLRNYRGKRSAKQPDAITSIGEGAEIEGKSTFTGAGTVLLNGKFQGEIMSTGALIVGEKAVVNATIRGGSVVIMGEVTGDVHASERVELKEGARVFGNLEAPVVVLEEGMILQGQCRTTTTRSDEPTKHSSVIPFKR